MQTFWLTFTDNTQASCQGDGEFDAKQIAEKLTGKTVAGGKYKDIAAVVLPYPADPCVWKFEHPLHGKTPSFCFRPTQCKGRTACPQNYSCTE
jgi:hypothetical protein